MILKYIRLAVARSYIAYVVVLACVMPVLSVTRCARAVRSTLREDWESVPSDVLSHACWKRLTK